MNPLRFLAMFSAIALVLASCGGDDEIVQSAGDEDGTDAPLG